MKTTRLYIFTHLFFFFFLIGYAQHGEENQQDFTLIYKLLRQDDKILIPESIKKDNWYLNLKEFRLSDQATLSFGGSYRFQSEAFINEQFDKDQDQNDIWFFNRFLFHSHLRVSDKFEVFIELNSATALSKEDIVPVDKDVLGINQFFVKYRIDDHWNIKLGRENFNIGARRLFDAREGPNVRRAFDMAQVNYKTTNFNLKAFFGVPLIPETGVFDNDFLNFNETISGVYTTTNFKDSTGIDAYLLYQKDNQVTYNSGTADERRYSVGIRHFGKINSFTFNNEALYQFGRFGDQNIAAWTVSFQLENETMVFNHPFHIGLKTELISGDRDASDNTLNTFDALYPRGAYFGRVARFGPSNLIDIHPYINVTFGKFFLEVDYDAFWRFSIGDGVYNAPLLLEYADTNDARFIAHQIGTIIGYELTDHIAIELETNNIITGAFLDQSNLDDNLFHSVFTVDIKF